MNRHFCSLYLIRTLLLFSSFHLCAQVPQYSGNPLFKGLYTADPCALVYNDTLYIFTGHDEQSQNGTTFLMRDWYVFSSADLVNWTYRGVINDLLENSETNHQAIIEFKGNWYFIYHNAGLPGGGTYRRSVCIDLLNYNDDGTIKKVVRTSTGVPAVNPTGVAFENKLMKPYRFTGNNTFLIINGIGISTVSRGTAVFNPLGIKQIQGGFQHPTGVYVIQGSR
jgi:hypothetical protein